MKKITESYIISGSTTDSLTSAYAAQFGTSAFAASPLGTASTINAAAGKQIEGDIINKNTW